MGCCADSEVTSVGNLPNPELQRKRGDKIKLAYWPFRGIHRGNVARYLLAYTGANWEEQNFKMGSDEWATFKSSGSIDFPNLPFIIDGDVNVTETFAVHRYICDTFKPELLGSNLAE